MAWKIRSTGESLEDHNAARRGGFEHPKLDPRKTDWVALDPHAYVMGCNRRPGLILPYLADQNHTLHIGEDYDLPEDAAPIKNFYASGSPLLSNYRVFRGHQDMMLRFLETQDPMALFFEDDAVPNTPDWVSIVNEAANTAPRDLEVLALYGRSFDYKRFEVDYRICNARREVLRLNDPNATEDCRGGKHHVYGTLAYLVTRAGAEKIAALEWEGIPCDVVFYDRTEFAFLNPSPFNHDRCQGSLLFPNSCPDRRPQALKEKPLVFDAPRYD